MSLVGLEICPESQVLVASHDKAFLEALKVTDQIKITRGTVGEPGQLTVTLVALGLAVICSDMIPSTHTYRWQVGLGTEMD